jgi:hypothetical protein
MHFMCDAGRMPVAHGSHQFRLPQSSADVKKSDWLHIVQIFTPRNLSEPSDKLPAISGVAKSYAKTCGYVLDDNNCLAGLWRADLCSHLCWRDISNLVLAMYQPATHHHGRRRLEARTRAPSWSWAAIDGPVYYDRESHLSAQATIIRCETRPEAGHGQFGRIESGILLLRCRFALVSLMEQTPLARVRVWGESASWSSSFGPTMKRR